MRFLVEVNALGQAEAKRYGVEADSWQKALQDARTLRGEDAPISGFSIELSDDGCRAIDPMARLRYVVRRASADLELGVLDDGVATATHRPQAAAAAGPVVVPATRVPAVTASVAPAPLATPSSRPGPASQRPPPPPVPSTRPPSQRPPGLSPKPPVPSTRPGPTAPLTAAAPSPSQRPPVASVRPPAAAIDAANDRTEPQSMKPPTATTASIPPGPAAARVVVLSHREQLPRADVPLFYLEETVLVPAGVPELELEAMLRAHLVSLGPELGKHARGRYVQIAAFDSAESEQKKTRPLVVLSWKDWKGLEPTFHHRDRDGARELTSAVSAFPPPSALPLLEPVAQNPSVAPAAPAASNAPPPTAPSIPPAASVPPPAVPSIAPAASVPPPAPFPNDGAIFSPSHGASAAPPPPNNGVHAQAHAAASAAVATAPSSSRSAPLRAGSSGGFPNPDSTRRRMLGDKRVPGEELIAQLFEEMHALHFMTDALEGGHFCLAVALEKLPSRAAYVHLYDIDKREFVIVCASGQGTEAGLLLRTGESDALLAAAMRKRRAVVINDEAEDVGMGAPRFATFGGAKRAIITPVMLAGRFLGVIELVNPVDGAPYTELEGNALTYMAEQYAEFVAGHGVVLEPDKVNRASLSARA